MAEPLDPNDRFTIEELAISTNAMRYIGVYESKFSRITT